MATEGTIGDLINRIKVEGDLNRNSGSHSVKSLKEKIDLLTPVLRSINASVANLGIITGILQRIEQTQIDSIEDRKRQEDFNPPDEPGDTDNGQPAPAGAPPVPPVEQQNILAIFGGLGLIGSVIAASLGGIMGVIKGQYDAIKAVGKILTPESWGALLDDLKTGVANRLSALRSGITSRIQSVIDGVTDGMQSIRNFLQISPDSAIGKAISGFRAAFAPITNLFTSMTDTIKGLIDAGDDAPLSRVKTFIDDIVKSFGTFGSKIVTIAKVVGKVFAPIAIITTAWDTITATIEGWQEGGILGALEGAITGFFTSLVTVPLDLVKSAVAWVLEKLGFDESASVLQSFSFTELFTSIVGSIFDGVKSAVDVIKDLFTFGEEDKTALGLLGKLTDLVYAPVNMAINFVRGLFGFEEGNEPFKLQDLISDAVNSAIDVIKDLFTFGEEDKTALGLLGKLTDLVFAPVNMAINFVKGLFGFDENSEEPFKLQDLISNALTGAGTWMAEKFANVAETVREKFSDLSDWVTGIPDRIKFAAAEMYINISARLKKGFMMFGEWFASIPARIKLLALETLSAVAITNPITGTRYSLIDDEDVATARSEVNARSSDLDARLQAVEDTRLDQLAALEREAAATQVIAPTTVTRGGDSNVQTTNYYTTTSTGASIDPAMPWPR